MKKLYTEEQYNQAKIKDLLPLECKYCNKSFFLQKKMINRAFANKGRIRANNYCSKSCQYADLCHPTIVNCTYCDKSFAKQPKEIKKYKNNFCCKSHAATWNNTHKTKGTRISKLEKWLSLKLNELYPNLEIHFNKKDAIDAELDIFIPKFKLAFELNGIFHYEPIYGDKKLLQTQTNDTRKMQACFERGIEICIIDVSNQTYFREKTSIIFLNIVKNIIDSKINNI